MLLDVRNNELVFTRVDQAGEFAKALQQGKDLKFRRVGATFYISLGHFDTARQVLSGFARQLRFTVRYERFAHLFVTNPNPIHIEWKPATCTISGSGMPWARLIPITSYFDKAAFNSTAYEKKHWDGRTNLLDAVAGSFPSGLLERIVRVLHEQGIPFTINQTFSYPAPKLQLQPVFEFTPTDDQVNAVAALDKANYGIAKLPTGFGKTSFVAAALIAKKGVRSMFLANQRVLISDAMKDFKSVFRNDHVRIGMIGDGEFAPGDITVASIQGVVAALAPPSPQEVSEVHDGLARVVEALRTATVDEVRESLLKDQKRYEKRIATMQAKIQRAEQIRPFLESIELFIVDEAQVLGTDMWNRFLHACPAPYRYTLSATPTRGDGGEIQIIAATGEMRFQSSAADQIAKGRLAEFQGHFVRFDHGIPKELSKQLKIDFHQAYNFFIMNNDKRNSHLCDKVIEYAKAGCSVLALVTRIDHAEIIQKMLLDKGMPEWTMAIVTGDTSKKVREDTIERYRKGEFPILIGSSIFDVGFNAKNASRMVRFNAGGSEVREPQRAGRTVRMREDGSHGESYDVLDLNVPYFENQSWKRRKLLQEEFGHDRIHVLPLTIASDVNVAALRDVIATIQEPADREAGERIIHELLAREGAAEVEAPDWIDELEQDEDLRGILEGLRFDTM